MEFQEQLRSLRKRRGLSQEELADALGVSRQAVQKWEAGTARPDLDNLTALARYFGVSLDRLVTGSDPAQATAQSQPSQPDPAEAQGRVVYVTHAFPHYEYKSQRTLWGLPLVHVNLSQGRMACAKGIIAVGNRAIGLVAVGGFSLGLVSIGGLAAGGLVLAGLGLGTFVFGGMAVGCVAVGGLAIGSSIAAGGCAIGKVALGGAAFGEVAMGAAAAGKNAIALGDNNAPTQEMWAQFWTAARQTGGLLTRWVLSLFGVMR